MKKNTKFYLFQEMLQVKEKTNVFIFSKGKIRRKKQKNKII